MGRAARLLREPRQSLRPSRMRTLLLVALLVLSSGLTILSLVVIRITLDRRIQRDLASDLQHSVATYRNIQRQRNVTLAREDALLADLPSLKALMTTEDARTIQDGGKDFWRLSGMELFQLYDRSGGLVASYGLSPEPTPNSAVDAAIERPRETLTLALNGGLYEVIAHPLFFGSRADGTLLGYVVLGSAIDQRVAIEVSQASAAEVAFTVNDRVAVSTLAAPLQSVVEASSAVRQLMPGSVAKVGLNGEEYLATVTPLTSPEATAQDQVKLIVFRSFSDATHLQESLNRSLLILGALALVLGAILAVSISRRVTRPLEALVDGARALGRGDFNYSLPGGGTTEIRELTQAFDHMRLDLESSQAALVGSERLATIGRMASSISHDLRHYISAIYANAEFLSLPSTRQEEREELIFEVETAVHGMTDLLDSLLLFSQTGKALVPTFESIPYLIERAVGLIRAHPEARSVDLRICSMPEVEVWVDATKCLRAVFNLLLNACQAASRGTLAPKVTLSLIKDDVSIVIRVEDNGMGVPQGLVCNHLRTICQSWTRKWHRLGADPGPAHRAGARRIRTTGRVRAGQDCLHLDAVSTGPARTANRSVCDRNAGWLRGTHLEEWTNETKGVSLCTDPLDPVPSSPVASWGQTNQGSPSLQQQDATGARLEVLSKLLTDHPSSSLKTPSVSSSRCGRNSKSFVAGRRHRQHRLWPPAASPQHRLRARP